MNEYFELGLVDYSVLDNGRVVVVFDDNPNIHNHSKLFTVSGYNVAVNLIEVIRKQLPNIYHICEDYYYPLTQSWIEYQLNPSRFNKPGTDTVFLGLLDELNDTIFDG